MVAALFLRVPFSEAWQALRHADLARFTPLVILAAFTWFAIESLVFSCLVSDLFSVLRWREGLALRGFTYLLTPIHWNAGKAAVVWRLHTKRGVPLVEGTSAILLYKTADAFLLALLALVGLLSLPASPLRLRAALAALALLLLLTLYAALLRVHHPGFEILDRLRALPLHSAHRRIRWRTVAQILGLKLVYYLFFVVVYVLGLRAFGVDVAIPTALAATPVIQMIGGLPITPAGLGTQQAAMLLFFSADAGSDARAPAVIAFAFGFPMLLMAARCAIGLCYLPSWLRARRGETPGAERGRRSRGFAA